MAVPPIKIYVRKRSLSILPIEDFIVAVLVRGRWEGVQSEGTQDVAEHSLRELEKHDQRIGADCLYRVFNRQEVEVVLF